MNNIKKKKNMKINIYEEITHKAAEILNSHFSSQSEIGEIERFRRYFLNQRISVYLIAYLDYVSKFPIFSSRKNVQFF